MHSRSVLSGNPRGGVPGACFAGNRQRPSEACNKHRIGTDACGSRDLSDSETVAGGQLAVGCATPSAVPGSGLEPVSTLPAPAVPGFSLKGWSPSAFLPNILRKLIEFKVLPG